MLCPLKERTNVLYQSLCSPKGGYTAYRSGYLTGWISLVPWGMAGPEALMETIIEGVTLTGRKTVASLQSAGSIGLGLYVRLF